MKHEYYEELISRLIDNDIDESEKHMLYKHMSVCKKCQNLQKDFMSLSSFMKREKTISVKPQVNRILLNALKIAAVLVFAVALSLVFFNSNGDKNIDLPSVSERYASSAQTEEYADKEIFSVLSSYSREEYSSEDGAVNDNTFLTYFSYVNDVR